MEAGWRGAAIVLEHQSCDSEAVSAERSIARDYAAADRGTEYISCQALYYLDGADVELDVFQEHDECHN